MMFGVVQILRAAYWPSILTSGSSSYSQPVTLLVHLGLHATESRKHISSWSKCGSRYVVRHTHSNTGPCKVGLCIRVLSSDCCGMLSRLQKNFISAEQLKNFTSLSRL